MEENEICIIVLDEENKEHMINVQNDIKYEDLKKLIILALNKNNDLEILYKGQIINESNKIIHLDDNEIIYLVSPNRNEDNGEDSDSSSSNDINNEIYEEGKEKKN